MTSPPRRPDPTESASERRAGVGRILLVVAALTTLVGPVATDAVWLRAAHMDNPAWLPHAKLHCAMSFLAAAAMGAAALYCAVRRPVHDRFAMGMSAFLGGAFPAGLVLAGLWPGASYGFTGDPVFGNDPPPLVGGLAVYPNVAASVLVVGVAVAGFLLTRGDHDRAAPAP